MTSGRHRWRITVLVVALAAIVAVDCLNATQSDSWADPGRASHLAAITKAPRAAASPAAPASRPNLSFAVLLMAVAVGAAIFGLLLARPRRSPSLRWRSCPRTSRAPPFLHVLPAPT